MDYKKLSLDKHREHKGKIEIKSKFPLRNINELSIAYTPGVAEVSRVIAENNELCKKYVSSVNSVAVITDGSAVLGLGNIGAKAALPVMEGKSVLFKEFAEIDSFPIALETQDTEEIIKSIKNIAPTFGGINLEDISAPRCFEIEDRLKEELNIPVFHDDQHGTAIVVLAGVINSLKLVNKNKEEIKVAINGAGAAGIAITEILYNYGIKNITVSDSKGIINKNREDLTPGKKRILNLINNTSGTLRESLEGADIFIGVSKGNLLNKEEISKMNKDPVVFALSNPTPEIMPEEAKEGGARIIATGRSDYPNQLNNVLVFPGIFKGALEGNKTDITKEMKLNAAIALADIIKDPKKDYIIPGPFDKNVVRAIADAVKNY